MRPRIILIVLLILGSGCSTQLEELRERYRPASLRDAYVHGLKETGIHDSRIGQAWIQEGDAVFRAPVSPTLPYIEEGRLSATDIMALGYHLELTRGQQVVVEASTPDGFQVFADLYEPMQEQGLPHRRLSSADSTGRLEWDVRRTKTYVLRVQPEILAEGSFRLSIRTDASLVFPVAGHSAADVQSRFGAERDGGRRSHHGIDIFARRGTPVVAVRSGRVRSTRTGGLGGKQVWLRDSLGYNYYYAHLDSQMVEVGQVVEPGDTLGTVGNTGNARTTPPHLHFGIYQSGPQDPWPFVFAPNLRPSRIAVDRSLFGSWRAADASSLTLRGQPSRRSPVTIETTAAARLHIIGGTASWYHVRLDDGRSGYLPASQLAMTYAASRPGSPSALSPTTVGS